MLSAAQCNELWHLFTEKKIPVIKAFCNCPLNPVFHGLITFTARLFHKKHMATTIMTNKSTLNVITMIFQVPEESCLAEGCWLFSFPGEAGVDSGAGGGSCAGDWFLFLLAFDTAGKAPLLRVVGRLMICLVGPTLTGAAARLLDWSSNFRRSKLPSTFWAITDSSEHTWCKPYLYSQSKSYISVTQQTKVQRRISTH